MEDLTELVRVGPDEPFILHPGEFVLGVVAERVALPDDIVATLDGKSSLGRLGLVVHQTAGVIDAGFDGHITLELANMANLPITVYPGMRIAQLSFMTLTTPADHPYGSAAAGQQVPGPGRADAQPLLPQLRGAQMRVLVRAAPATSAARWWRRCCRPATRCGRWCTDGDGCPTPSRRWPGDVRDAGVGDARRPQGCEAIVNLVAILDGSDERVRADQRRRRRETRSAAARAHGIAPPRCT